MKRLMRFKYYLFIVTLNLKVPDHVIDEFFVQISRYTDDLDEDI